jgi:hypothetical protein
MFGPFRLEAKLLSMLHQLPILTFKNSFFHVKSRLELPHCSIMPYPMTRIISRTSAHRLFITPTVHESSIDEINLSQTFPTNVAGTTSNS